MNSVLIDTSVWVNHLRVGRADLSALLEAEQVVCHPFVIGELACGHLRPRGEILRRLARLPAAPVADHDEVLSFIDRRSLGGIGVGWIDVNLLASALLIDAGFWTLDRRLAECAQRLGLEGPT